MKEEYREADARTRNRLEQHFNEARSSYRAMPPSSFDEARSPMPGRNAKAAPVDATDKPWHDALI